MKQTKHNKVNSFNIIRWANILCIHELYQWEQDSLPNFDQIICFLKYSEALCADRNLQLQNFTFN